MAVMDAFGLLVGVVIVAVAAYWVHKDAKSKGVRDPDGWAVLTFLFFITVFRFNASFFASVASNSVVSSRRGSPQA
jgi:hypothetical protein